MKYYIGVDLGGTNLKGGIINEDGLVFIKKSIKTDKSDGAGKVIIKIVDFVKSLILEAGLTENDIEGLGIGIPGMIDPQNGLVITSCNLNWKNVMICNSLKKSFSFKIKISNDANVACLGEYIFGSAKNYHNCVLITLGTGVGSGIVVDGKILSGNMGAGAEIGHMVIRKDGELCNCGRRGCLEAYASATALVRDTKKAMKNDLSSLMWQDMKDGLLDNVSGRTAFKYQKVDKSARLVVKNYIEYLAEGLSNIANIFRPEVIILGGGISNEGENLIRPLVELCEKYNYGGEFGPAVKIDTASLYNDAGFMGAAALCFEPKE